MPKCGDRIYMPLEQCCDDDTILSQKNRPASVALAVSTWFELCWTESMLVLRRSLLCGWNFWVNSLNATHLVVRKGLSNKVPQLVHDEKEEREIMQRQRRDAVCIISGYFWNLSMFLGSLHPLLFHFFFPVVEGNLSRHELCHLWCFYLFIYLFTHLFILALPRVFYLAALSPNYSRIQETWKLPTDPALCCPL